jgi:hypothetical protein
MLRAFSCSSFRRRPESSQVRRAKHTTYVVSASHSMFALDSGLRRNDGSEVYGLQLHHIEAHIRIYIRVVIHVLAIEAE